MLQPQRGENKGDKPVAGTRERILRAAVNEFAAKGFSGGGSTPSALPRASIFG